VPTTGFAFDSTGKTLIGTVNGKPQLLAAATGEPIPFKETNDDYVRGGIWPSADGKRFATLAGVSNEDRTARKPRLEVWDLANEELIRSFELDREKPGRRPRLDGVALSVDGRKVAAAFFESSMRGALRQMLKQWNVTTRELRLFGPIESDEPRAHGELRLAVSPNGETLAVPGAGGLLDLIDASTFTLRRTVELGPSGTRLNDIAFAPDGNHLVTANGNGTLYVLRLKR
jgi:WD40 repeat protein